MRRQEFRKTIKKKKEKKTEKKQLSDIMYTTAKAGGGQNICARKHLPSPTGEGIEEGLARDPVAGRLEHLCRHDRHPVDALRDFLHALRTVVHAVRRRHVGQQRLGGADVGSRLIPPATDATAQKSRRRTPTDEKLSPHASPIKFPFHVSSKQQIQLG